LKFFNLGSVASSEELARKVKDSIGVSNGLSAGGKDRRKDEVSLAFTKRQTMKCHHDMRKKCQ
jgi:hypothetical protein